MLKALAAGYLGISLVASTSTGHAQGNCVSRGEGRELLEQGEAMPFPDALRQAGLPPDQVVDVQLCRTGSDLVYHVRIVEGATVRGVSIAAASSSGNKSGSRAGGKSGDNPGNNKNVGRAGESPNGKGFGRDGNRGRSDAGGRGAGTEGGGKSTGSGRGSSNGNNKRN